MFLWKGASHYISSIEESDREKLVNLFGFQQFHSMMNFSESTDKSSAISPARNYLLLTLLCAIAVSPYAKECLQILLKYDFDSYVNTSVLSEEDLATFKEADTILREILSATDLQKALSN